MPFPTRRNLVLWEKLVQNDFIYLTILKWRLWEQRLRNSISIPAAMRLLWQVLCFPYLVTNPVYAVCCYRSDAAANKKLFSLWYTNVKGVVALCKFSKSQVASLSVGRVTDPETVVESCFVSLALPKILPGPINLKSSLVAPPVAGAAQPPQFSYSRFARPVGEHRHD